MLDEIARLAGWFLGTFIGLVTVTVALFPVFWISYAVWRHLHYMRRIADALETHAAEDHKTVVEMESAVAMLRPKTEGRITHSAFGR